MKILVLVLGTRGDVEMFLHLGRELSARGHSVTLAASPFYAEAARASDLEWLGVGSGSRAELVALLRSLRALPTQRSRVEAYFEGWVRPQLAESLAEVRDAAAGADYFIDNLRSVWTRDGEVIPGANVTYEPPGSLENLAKQAPRRVDHAGRLIDLVALERALVDPEGEWGDRYRFTGFWLGSGAIGENEPPDPVRRFGPARPLERPGPP